MTNRFTQIGFSQRIRLDWMEQTANLVLIGNDPQAIEASLQTLLADKLSVGGQAVRGNREKAITILMKIWVRPPQELQPLHQDGLKLLTTVPRELHIVLHWGMSMAVYPFWGAVAEQVGRLLKLQGALVPRQVQRRLRERYGERETVARAARRVLRSFVDWGVLRDKSKGTYIPDNTFAIQQLDLIAWLTEAYLNAQPTGKASTREILNSPSLFPFHLSPLSADAIIAQSSRLELLRHGLDDELIMLRQ